jgi:hypothetical protein
MPDVELSLRVLTPVDHLFLLADTLRLPTSCVCSDANMADVADQAANTWKVRTHACWLHTAWQTGTDDCMQDGPMLVVIPSASLP